MVDRCGHTSDSPWKSLYDHVKIALKEREINLRFVITVRILLDPDAQTSSPRTDLIE